MEKLIKVGDPVIWVDPVGRQCNALVTTVWSAECINVVIVSGDDSKTDSYGRQIERQTSVQSKRIMGVHGRYFMLPGETPNPIAEPAER